jgi:hypothetical protein
LHGLDDIAVLDAAQPHHDGERDDGDRHVAVEPLVLGLGAEFDFHDRLFRCFFEGQPYERVEAGAIA